MNSHKIIILDYSVGMVHVFPFDISEWENPEDFILKVEELYGIPKIDISDCHYMVVRELSIDIY